MSIQVDGSSSLSTYESLQNKKLEEIKKEIADQLKLSGTGLILSDFSISFKNGTITLKLKDGSDSSKTALLDKAVESLQNSSSANAVTKESEDTITITPQAPKDDTVSGTSMNVKVNTVLAEQLKELMLLLKGVDLTRISSAGTDDVESMEDATDTTVASTSTSNSVNATDSTTTVSSSDEDTLTTDSVKSSSKASAAVAAVWEKIVILLNGLLGFLTGGKTSVAEESTTDADDLNISLSEYLKRISPPSQISGPELVTTVASSEESTEVATTGTDTAVG